MYKNPIVKLVIIALILTAQSALVSAKPGITVDVASVNPKVVPPGIATYSVAVVSESNENEMVTLSIVNSKDGWSYSFGENDFALPSLETRYVELQIAVPAGTANGEYFHDVKGFATVPGQGSDSDEETFYLDVLTVAIPEFPTVALPVAIVIGMLLVMGRRKRGE